MFLLAVNKDWFGITDVGDPSIGIVFRSLLEMGNRDNWVDSPVVGEVEQVGETATPSA